MVDEATETISEELNTQETEQGGPPEGRRRAGRPEGAKNKGPDPTFFERLKDLDWEKNVVYIYRTEPLVDLTTGGGPKYATKYAEPFDEDKVMRDLGSGKYQARVSETQKTTGKGKQTDVYTFEIFNTQFPPQIPVGAWLDDHRNARWKWAKDAIAQQQPAAPGSPQASGQDVGKLVQTIGNEFRQQHVDPTVQFKAMTEAHRAGIEQGLEVARQSTPATSGGGEVIELLKTLLPSIVARKEPDNSVVQVLTLQLTAEREQRKADREQAIADRAAADKRAEAAESRHNALMTALLEKKESSGTDVIEQFSKMFGMFNQIREGGLGASDESWSGIIKEGLREAAPDLMRTLAPAAAGILGGLGQGAPRQIPPTGVSRETISPVLPPVNQNQPSGAPPAQQAAAPPFDPQFSPAYSRIFMSQDTILAYLRQGKTGLDFGDWLADGPGELEIEKLKAAGPENLIKFIATQLPPFWAELQPVQVRFQQFLGELMTWTPDDGSEDGDDPPADGPQSPPNMPGTAKERSKGKKANAGGKVQ